MDYRESLYVDSELEYRISGAFGIEVDREAVRYIVEEIRKHDDCNDWEELGDRVIEHLEDSDVSEEAIEVISRVFNAADQSGGYFDVEDIFDEVEMANQQGCLSLEQYLYCIAILGNLLPYGLD